MLMSAAINLCLAHADKKIITDTLKKWAVVLKNIKSYSNSEHPSDFLKGDLVKPVFEVRRSK